MIDNLDTPAVLLVSRSFLTISKHEADHKPESPRLALRIARATLEPSMWILVLYLSSRCFTGILWLSENLLCQLLKYLSPRLPTILKQLFKININET